MRQEQSFDFFSELKFSSKITDLLLSTCQSMKFSMGRKILDLRIAKDVLCIGSHIGGTRLKIPFVVVSLDTQIIFSLKLPAGFPVSMPLDSLILGGYSGNFRRFSHICFGDPINRLCQVKHITTM